MKKDKDADEIAMEYTAVEGTLTETVTKPACGCREGLKSARCGTMKETGSTIVV